MNLDTPAKQGAFDKIAHICKRAADIDVGEDLYLTDQKTEENQLTFSAVWTLRGEVDSHTQASYCVSNDYGSLSACHQAAYDYGDFRDQGLYQRFMKIAVDEVVEINGGLSTQAPSYVAIDSRTFEHSDECPKCRAQGRVMCGDCQGTGDANCYACYGRGSHVCHSCGGTQTVHVYDSYTNANELRRCSFCNYQGEITCAGCNGTGKRSCYHCNGRGELTCDTCSGMGYQTTTYTATITAERTILFNSAHRLVEWQRLAVEAHFSHIQNMAAQQKAKYVYEEGRAVFHSTIAMTFNEIGAALSSWSGKILSLGSNSEIVHSYDFIGDIFLEPSLKEYDNNPSTEMFKKLVSQPIARNILSFRAAGDTWLTKDSFMSDSLVRKLVGAYQEKLSKLKRVTIELPFVKWFCFSLLYALIAWLVITAGVAAHSPKDLNWFYLGLSGLIIGKTQYLHWWLSHVLTGLSNDFGEIVAYLQKPSNTNDPHLARKALYGTYSLAFGAAIFALIYFWVRKRIGRSVSKIHSIEWRTSIALLLFILLYMLYPVMPDWRYALHDNHYFLDWWLCLKDGLILGPDFLIIGMIMAALQGRQQFIRNYHDTIRSYDISEINEDLNI